MSWGNGLSILLLSGFLAGCWAVVGPDEERRLGVIAFHGDPVVVGVPETAEAGAPFDVTIRTYGGGCISKGDTEVTVRGLVVDVVPYDVHSGHNVCTSELRQFEHRATVTLTNPGIAQVRFRGQSVPADTSLVVIREVVIE